MNTARPASEWKWRGPLILGSGSARRHELLRAAGVPFTVEVSDVDEDLEGRVEPEVAAVLLAQRKARAVAAAHLGQPCWIVGADTVVAAGAGDELELLGKPVDEADARRMLQRLSTSRHRVVTGIAVLDCARFDPEGEAGDVAGGLWTGFERTWVSMRQITDSEIEAYVASGEWLGKAGGYAIQEHADVFVTELAEGGFDNVVGLPVALTLELLHASGALLAGSTDRKAASE